MKEGSRPLTVFNLAFFLLLFGHNFPLMATYDSLRISIAWKTPIVNILETGIEEKGLTHENMIHLDEHPGIPFSQVILPNTNIEFLTVTVLEFADATDEEIDLLKKIEHRNLPMPINNLRHQDKIPLSYIHFPSLAVDSTDNKIKKIKSSLITFKKKQSSQNFNKRTASARNSVLATGDWYKFAIPEKGIYKITYDQLKKIGVPVDNIDARNISIFGNGGGMLPQGNDEERLIDLSENAIYVSSQMDGKFSTGDFILFYGQGADKIEYNVDQNAFVYEKNIYSDSTYYFLTIKQGPGIRMTEQANLGESFPTIDHFDDYMVHEKDEISVNFSGREWFGELFNNLKPFHHFTFPAEGLKGNSEIRVTCSFLNTSFIPTTYSLSLNNLDLGTVDLLPVAEGPYIDRGRMSNDTFSINSSLINASDNKLNVKITYQGNSINSSAHLDYLFVSISRNLLKYGHQTFFRNVASLNSTHITYKVGNMGSTSMIWDVTEPFFPKNQGFNVLNGSALFGAPSTELREFVAFSPDLLPSPLFIEKVVNQNLQGDGLYNMVIVTHEKFREDANRLAAFREAQDQITVKVTTAKEIYNEFSSGAKDVTAIRDYMKYLYGLDVNGESLKYLLLFGKSSYDIKNKVPGNINYVPIYGSRNSLHPIYSYSSDDYYGFLDDDEGEWIENTSGDHLMDIGIGRIPVRNSKEAKLVVDKIIHYSTAPETFGPWRKEIYFVADDGDFNLHQLDADKLANLTDTTFSDYNVNKIYLDSYPQIDKGSNREAAPAVNKAINDAIKSGSLIVNYTGHGGQYQWADESILDTLMISKWKNYHKLPFFVTATCTFGKHDDPITQSGGEKMLLGTNAGAIGLITSSRPVFSSTNYALNLSFYNHVFSKVDGENLTLGEIFKLVKNSSLKGSVNRNFALLGDPSMKLSYPKKAITITSIENRSQSTDTIKALGKVTIRGKVTDHSGGSIESFNGILHATVYDKMFATTTLGLPSMTYKERNSTIFRGKASVSEGNFEFNFIVSKNISYDFNNGKISLYAIDHSTSTDAVGSNQKIKIGGSDSNAVADRTPPEIRLYLNDTTFRNGGITASNSLLLARIYDENGISITNNFNHTLTATLNDNQVYILNDFYEAEIDDYQVGWINYPMDDLPKGKNKIVLKVWDTHNNMTESSLEFYVEEDVKLSLNNLINYPNPFYHKTKFQFDHNAAGENLLVRIDIYSIRGEHVYGIENLYPLAPATINTLEWDGRNSYGQILKEGVYIYKVSVHSEATGRKNQQYKRLIFKN